MPEQHSLLVLVEGINDEHVLKVVLRRGRELQFEPLREPQVEFRRHSSEVCTSGAEVARSLKRQYSHFLLVWDHEGSSHQAQGRPPNRAQGMVQAQLNTYSLKDCSKAVVITPELEIWLWSDLNAIAQVLQKPQEDIQKQLEELQNKEGLTYASKPKETLQMVAAWSNERADSDLYERIAEQSDLNKWLQQHSSFKSLTRALRRWFPLHR